ncbi:FAD-dependent oxidoreductase [Microbulbifer agarilyticus]|uniref:FAD-dependent oxidoreductase n=1 Tax=Microbulbifer agarilyticus TaxID=260552 RepID=UPI001CD6C615|nr:FAD-dependent oxidoreductase [Microbulbifer agarilyticus]MCA0901818.1 FAD-dependent oxidoreductase [Microbulbifer agarilyticus]
MSNFRVWECQICGWIYDEAKGSPDDGIPPGTRWEDVPDDWACPECGASKDEFEMLAVVGNAPTQQSEVSTVPQAAVAPAPTASAQTSANRIWECMVCGWIYDESKGAPEEGIAPGTRWEDIPDDWTCPECGVGKEDFDMVLISQPAPEAAPAAQAETAPLVLDDTLPTVIIGTGLAGYHLAKEFRKLDQRTPLTLITGDDGTFYSKPLLSASLAHGKTPQQLATASAEDMARELNAEILVHTHVTNLDRDAKLLSLVSDGGISAELPYGRLVFATGANCTPLPPMEGNGMSRLFRVNNLSDYHRFRTALANRKRVLLIGAGLIGCEFANDLIQAGYSVDVVDVQAWPLATLLPEAAGHDIQNTLEQAGVRFHFGAGVTKLEQYAGGIRAQLANGSIIEADLALAALGLKPNVGLAESAGLTIKRGIATNRALQTSDADIFALGDCAEVDGHNLFFVAPLTQSARALAQTLAGNHTEVQYGTLPVAVKTTLRPTVVCPPRAGSFVEGTADWKVTELEDGIVAEFLSNDGQLLGFALTGSGIAQRDNLSKRCVPLMDS